MVSDFYVIKCFNCLKLILFVAKQLAICGQTNVWFAVFSSCRYEFLLGSLHAKATWQAGFALEKSHGRCHNPGLIVTETSLESSPSWLLSTPQTDAG